MGASAAASEAAERKLAGFNDEAERASKAASAAAQATKLVETVSRAIPNSPRTSQNKQIEGVAEVASIGPNGQPDGTRAKVLGNELKLLRDQGDMAGLQSRLEQIKRDFVLRGVLARHQELELLSKQTDEIRDQLELAKQKNDPKRVAELESKLSEVGDRRTQKIVAHSTGAEEDRKAFLETDQKHLNFLEQEKLLAQSISDIYKELPSFRHSDKLDAEIAATQAQIKHSEAVLNNLQNDPSLVSEAENERKKTGERIAKEISETRKLLSETSTQLSTLPESTRDLAESQADRNRLRQERKNELRDLDGRLLSASQQNLLALQATVEKQDLLAEKDRLLVQLRKEQINLAREQQREFQKSLLMSGPSDMLRKLAVKSLGDRGRLNLGSFMALSPEGRRDAAEAFPRFNPRVWDLNRQMAELGQERSLAQKLQDQRQASVASRNLRSLAAPNIPGSDSHNEISRSAKLASDSLKQFHGAIVGRVIPALNALSAKLESISGGAKQVASPAPLDMDSLSERMV